MRATLTNPVNGRKYRIRPYSNGMCLMIERQPLGTVNKKNGKPIKSEFTSCDKYPATWREAIRTVVQMILLDTEEERDVEVTEAERLAEAGELSAAKTMLPLEIAKVTDAIVDKVANISYEIERSANGK